MFFDSTLTSAQLQKIKEMGSGRLPRHLAVIMDGTRRFSKKKGMPTAFGYDRGIQRMMQLFTWCLQLGIPEITVFGLSIEHFQRRKEDVHALILLIGEAITQAEEILHLVKDQGIRIHIAGRMSLFPEDMRAESSRIILATRHGTKLRVNVALGYTGRDEICRAASQLASAVQNNMIKAEDIDEALMSSVMDFGEPDLVIRTSGEKKLPDFMLWQVPNAILYFPEVSWIEFSVDTLLAAIVHFQRFTPRITHTVNLSERQLNLIKHLKKQRWTELENISHAKNISSKL